MASVSHFGEATDVRARVDLASKGSGGDFSNIL